MKKSLTVLLAALALCAVVFAQNKPLLAATKSRSSARARLERSRGSPRRQSRHQHRRRHPHLHRLRRLGDEQRRIHPGRHQDRLQADHLYDEDSPSPSTATPPSSPESIAKPAPPRQDYVHRVRFTDTWIRQSGIWRCVASQSTLIQASEFLNGSMDEFVSLFVFL
jgi:hypothetical protein